MTFTRLYIERARDAERTVLTLRGEVDRANVALLGLELTRATNGQSGSLEVDVQQLDYIDAGGLRVLQEAARRVRHSGHPFVLRNPKPSLRRLLILTGLDRGITMEPARVHS